MTQNAINNTASILAVDNLTLDGNTLSSTDTNGDIVLAPDGTGDVSVTTSPIVPSGDRADSLGSATNSWDNVYADGLTFDDGTNILANFVDSTAFTPVLEFGGGTTGIVYVVQQGSYTRIGNMVFANIAIHISNQGSSVGNATITGFPFTAALARQAFAIGQWNAITFSANNYLATAVFTGATSTIGLQQCGSNVAFTALTDVSLSNTSRIFCSLTVRI